MEDAPLVLVDVLAANGSGTRPTVRDASQPFLYADDLGAVRGDGVFETLLIRDGRIHNQKRHEQRFLNSVEMLQLPAISLDDWRAATDLAVAELLRRTDGLAADATLRWVYSRGRESTGQPTGYVLATVAPPLGQVRDSGVSVMLAERGYTLELGSKAPWVLIGAKTLSYAANMAALRYAADQGFDDVIFTSHEGNILEGPTSTVVIVRDGQLITPTPGAGILPGTTQAALFALAQRQGWQCHEQSLVEQDLREASSVWLVSSVRLAVRVTAINGVELPVPDEAEERQIQQLVAEAVAAEG